MPSILNVSKHHSGPNILAVDKNDDSFTLNIPAGETFDTCNLTITSAHRAGASVSTQSARGATGTPAIKIHCDFDAGGSIDYLVRRLGESFDIPTGVATYQALMNPSLPDHETDLSRLGVGPHGRAWVAIRQEWPKIKSDLDAHRLSPIGLICLRSNDPRDL